LNWSKMVLEYTVRIYFFFFFFWKTARELPCYKVIYNARSRKTKQLKETASQPEPRSCAHRLPQKHH
jgi:hypothetical protein